MKNQDTSTAALETALRYLAANPTKKISFIATKFKLSEKDLWAWLEKYNHSRKNLPAHIIDSAKTAEQADTTSATSGKAKGVAAMPASKKTAVAPVAAAVPKLGPTSDIGRWLDAQGVPIVGRANTFLVTVTPALAAAWLQLNVGNRNPSKAKVKRFAAAIAAGKWTVNGETLKFSVSGRLLDGRAG